MIDGIAPLLDVSDLHLAIGDRPILRGISIGVASGKVVGLVGESGAGKTMLGRVVLGIQPHNSRVKSGKVLFDQNDITHQSERQRAHLLGREIALVPQNPMTALNPVMRCGDQIDEAFHRTRLSPPERRARALTLLREVALQDPERILASYAAEEKCERLPQPRVSVAQRLGQAFAT